MNESRESTPLRTVGLWWAVCVLVVGLGLHAVTPSLATPAGLSAAQVDNAPSVDASTYVDQYLAVAEQIDPSLADQLRSMCQLDPQRFGRVLKQLGPGLGELVKLRERDPALYQQKIHQLHLDATIESLAASILASLGRGEQPNSARQAQLRGLVEAQIAAQLRTQQRELDEMRRQLERAEADLDRRRKDFAGEVSRRVKWLLSR